jgi:hypothetical protein
LPVCQEAQGTAGAAEEHTMKTPKDEMPWDSIMLVVLLFFMLIWTIVMGVGMSQMPSWLAQ